MSDWYSMSDEDKQKAVDSLGLLLMLTIAVLLACVAVGMMFGAAWGFAAAAAFAVFEYVIARRNIKRSRRKKADDDE